MPGRARTSPRRWVWARGARSSLSRRRDWPAGRPLSSSVPLLAATVSFQNLPVPSGARCLVRLAVCARGRHLGTVGSQELHVARKIVCPVTGEAATALGTQRPLEGGDDMRPARRRHISELTWPERKQFGDLGAAAREVGIRDVLSGAGFLPVGAGCGTFRVPRMRRGGRLAFGRVAHAVLRLREPKASHARGRRG